MEEPICIIPARGGSKRLPRKNIRELAGKPLLSYTIGPAIEAGLFSRVYVSSEDPEILEIAKAFGADPLSRPSKLATDDAQVKDVLAHHLGEWREEGRSPEAFAVLLATTPLRRASDLRDAYTEFRNSGADALMSVVPFTHPPQRAVAIRGGRIRPHFGRENMLQTQKLEQLYRHDGSFVFARTDAFLEQGRLYADDTAPYILPPERTVDIDEEIDLKWAEFILGHAEES